MKAPTWEFPVKSCHGRKSGAVAEAYVLDIQARQPRGRLSHASLSGGQQMHPAHDRVDAGLAGSRANVFQRVHDAGMRAAQQYDEPFGCLDEHCLVIDDQVCCGAGLVEVECAPRVLILIPAGYLTGEPDAAAQADRSAPGGDHLPDAGTQPVAGFDGSTDGTHLAVVILDESRAKGREVRVHLRLPEVRQCRRQSAGVIVVAVAQGDLIDGGQIDTQDRRVVLHRQALARVEQNATAVSFDPEGQSVLGQQIQAVGGILDQYGD